MDVITLGETMVTLIPESSGPLRFVSNFHKSIGGAESNVAIALARLGHKVGWISRLGDDEFGLFIRNVIRGEGVDTSQTVFDKDFSTGILIKERTINEDPNIYYYRNNSAASKMVPEQLEESYFKQAKYLHITGITPALSESCRQTVLKAIELAKSNHQKIIFDPNIRLKLWSEQEAQSILLDIAAKSDILLPGMDEGELLTGEKTPEKIAKFFLEKGSSLVIVKLGEQGAYFSTKELSSYVPGFKVETIIDTVGAGDGFAAGVISGLLRGWSYYDSVKLGNKIGAFALSVQGDFEAFPYFNELDEDNKLSKVSR